MTVLHTHLCYNEVWDCFVFSFTKHAVKIFHDFFHLRTLF